MQEIKFYLPDFYYLYDLHKEFIRQMNLFPEKFREGVKIASIYGCFPSAIWNGGRVMTGFAEYDNMINTVKGINDEGVAVRYTFTNQALKDYHVFDEYCNNQMRVADNGQNEVLVNLPFLEKYLRENYPNFKYISSTTKCLLDPDEINRELDNDDYALVVLDFRKNRDYKLLEKIERKDKVELLINAYCSPECKQRKEHYQYLSECQLKNKYADVFCDTLKTGFYNSMENSTFIKVEELYSTYVDMGYTNFKIEGRTLPKLDVIESMVYYLVRPEERDLIRYNILYQIL